MRTISATLLHNSKDAERLESRLTVTLDGHILGALCAEEIYKFIIFNKQ